MAKMQSVYPGKLILPDGTEILPNTEVEVSKEMAANAGVAEWISAGYLVKPGSVARGLVSDDSAAIKAELDRVTASLASESALRADLEAKNAQLTADLEAATKPAA